jgi:transposase
MANVLSEEKRQQVIALGRLGWSLRRIEAEVGVRRETAASYLRQAGVEIRAPGRWGRPKPANEVTTDSSVSVSPEEPKPANEVTTDSAFPVTAPVKSQCAPFHELIVDSLTRRRNAIAIYQELVDRHGYVHSYESVKRYVRALRGARTPEAHPIIETAPGDEGQVDYGEGPMVRHSETGKYRRTRLFVMTLGFSRKSVRLLCWKSSSEIWAQLHEKAFRRLGGAPRTMVPDNLKEGVLKPDVYEPTLNPLYRDVLKHYGVIALPCRVRHPDRKGKVESGIGHTQRTPLQGMRFESLEAAQEYLDAWEERWADTRIHGTTKRQVTAMFAEEKPHLLPLPVEPFRYYRFGQRTVHLDGCVEVEGAYYMAPPGHIGRRIHVQWDELHVRLLDPRTGMLLREHLRQSAGRYRVAPGDAPKKTPASTLELLSRACRAGASIGALCEEIQRREPVGGVRRILGTLALARRHGVPAVEDACIVALEMGVPTYRFVRRYVERRAPPALSLKQVDELIRPLTHYRDLIHRMTEGAEQNESRRAEEHPHNSETGRDGSLPRGTHSPGPEREDAADRPHLRPGE